MRFTVALVALVVVVGACGDASVPEATVTTGASEGCADVIEAEAEATADATYLFRVTVRSADTGPEKYADAWEVRAPDGTVLGTRELLHDHVGEQPFTRTLSGVAVPSGTTEVVIAARDSVVGFCGAELTVPVG